MAQIELPQDALVAFCERYHVRKLSLFGSVLHDDFGPGSDVDVLVEFEPGQTASFFTFAGMQTELSEMVGRAVDLHTPASLSRYFRDSVLRSAEVRYERTG